MNKPCKYENPDNTDKPERHSYIWNKKEIFQLGEELKCRFAISQISKRHKRTPVSIILAIDKYFPSYSKTYDYSEYQDKSHNFVINGRNYGTIFNTALDYVNYRIELL